MNITQANYPKAAAYCKAWRTAKTVAAESPRRRIQVFRGHFPVEASIAYEGFIDALHIRINKRGGVTFTGRKHSEEYQNRLARDCYTVRDHATKRIIVRPRDLSTPDIARRFAHIVTHPWEE